MVSISATRLRRLHAEKRSLDRLIEVLQLETRSPAHPPDLYANVPRMMKAASDFLHDALAEIQLLLADGPSKEELREALQSLLQSEMEDRWRRLELLEDTVSLLGISKRPPHARLGDDAHAVSEAPPEPRVTAIECTIPK